ncbi:hypothetical protein ABE504_33050, partial [Paenibacillus oryzisoli]
MPRRCYKAMFVGSLSLLDEKIDAKLHMQLVDLARLFTGRKELEVEAAYHAHYASDERKLTVSQFWWDYGLLDKTAGMKTDVYLRALGSGWFTGAAAVRGYLAYSSGTSMPKLANSVFALCEDMRLERICRRLRPGTGAVFAHRHRILASYYAHKLQVHLRKGELADAAVLLLYGWFTGQAWHGELPGQFSALADAIARTFPLLEQVEEAQHTEDVAQVCRLLLELLTPFVGADASAAYFWVQVGNGAAQPLPADYRGELKRAKPLAGSAVLPDVDGERQLPGQERMPTWHRETSDRSPGLLRFELERGSRTAAEGSAPREGDAADQALALAQGRSQRAKRTGAARTARREAVVPPDGRAGGAS